VHLTDLKGCGKPLVVAIEHNAVYWSRGAPKKMQYWRSKPQTKSRVCGTYMSSWGTRVYLCDDCIIKNGLKW